VSLSLRRRPGRRDLDPKSTALRVAGGALGLVLAAAAGGAPAPAAGGPSFLAAAEGAQHTLLGVVREPTRVDLHGWAATLGVERDLDGRPTTGNETVRIAWEELAPERPPRFGAGDAILVALEPLPLDSIWHERFPHGDALAVAGRGAAFLSAPDNRSVDLLATFLQLPREERGETAGVTALAALAAQGMPPLALEAVQGLDAVPGLSAKLGEGARANLVGTLSDADRPVEVRRAVVELAGSRHLLALREPLQALAESGPPLEADAWSSLAALDGELPPETVKRLIASPDPATRAVAARLAPGSALTAQLETLAAKDPSAEVRASAVEALLTARGAEALEAGLAALSDPDPGVRGAAVRAVGGLGAAAVPSLRSLAEARTGSGAAAPLAALVLAGPEGRVVVMELAQSHPDAKTRGLARLLLGQDPYPPH
jgi:HEAT repeats